MSDGMTDDSRRDRISQRRVEQRTSSLGEITRRIQSPGKKPCCPICGSEDGTKVVKFNGIRGPGGHSQELYWVCDGCTIVFKKKEKFFR